RKAEWVGANAKAVAEAVLGRKMARKSNDEWVSTGVVLIAGYGGTRSHNSKYPIMPVLLFEKGMGTASSLKKLASWCQSSSWLPQEGKHFTMITTEFALDGTKPLILQGADILERAEGFLSEAVASLSGPKKGKGPSLS
ncbi:MAG: hypothetical protein Q7T59_06090, partial [Candidatus Woesebacteria bacterium]|nr:hypothetical protein [Candidatus Woesebacteria bacterium]